VLSRVTEPDAGGASGQRASEQLGSATPVLSVEETQRRRLAELLDAQNRSLAVCDQRFAEAIGDYRHVADWIEERPVEAAARCRATVDGLLADMAGQGESSIRLLSEGPGDRALMHPVNVTVLSLLLGKALGCSVEELHDLGTAAFLHDIGKTRLLDRVRWIDTNFSPAETRSYQEHVPHGVLIARQLGLSSGALCAIAQHHEMMDGAGFPRRTRSETIRLPGRILALVNRYENMCNPARPATAVTPHEALSLIFSQMKACFDQSVLSAFIRMMGVYPPGSVVQLSDDRFALVASVNSARPLKPRVIVHVPGVPKAHALIVDLELAHAPGIRRSLRPIDLPRAAMDYLSPRLRICHFFERATDPAPVGAPA